MKSMKYLLPIVLLFGCFKKNEISRDEFNTALNNLGGVRDSLSRAMLEIERLKESQRSVDPRIFKEKAGIISFQDTVFLKTVVADRIIKSKN